MACHPLAQIAVQRRLMLAVALPLILMILLAGTFLGLIGYLQTSAAAVDNTDRVLGQAHRLQTLLIDRETGLRGYLLTGDPGFLTPYHEANRVLEETFDALGRLVAQDTAQQERLRDLRALASDWARYAEGVIALRREGGAYQVVELHRDGKQRMDLIREQLLAFMASETQLREQRSAAVVRATWTAVAGGLLISLLLGGFLAVVTLRQIRTVARLHEAAHAEIEARSAELRDAAERFGALFEQAPLGIATIRSERVLAANSAFVSAFGFADLAELVERPWPSLLAPSYRDDLRSVVVEGGPDAALFEAYDAVGLRKNGSSFPFRLRMAWITLPDGPAIVAYLTDRSVQQRLEEQVRQMQKLENVGRLAGSVAHDFNNLLTVVTGALDLARTALPDDHPVQHDLHIIQQAIDRTGSLTRRLLAFARKQPIAPKNVNLNDLIEAVEPLLRRLLNRTIDLRIVREPNLRQVVVDPSQIEQVLVNLVVNARDAMPSGGQLTIETSNVHLDDTYAQQHMQITPGLYVLLAVTDTGTGMEPEVKQRLFEPFFTTKGPDHGTGLGLATSYGIVTQHGGQIIVYSELGEGSTFKVYLPCSRVEARSAAVLPQPDASRATETVLLVEDEVTILTAATRVLREAGYTVLEASDGEQATRLAETHPGPIDLLLVDVVLPCTSGPVLAKQLHVLHPAMKTLFISGYGDQALVHQGRLTKGMVVLQKPFAMATLLQSVRAALDKPGKSS